MSLLINDRWTSKVFNARAVIFLTIKRKIVIEINCFFLSKIHILREISEKRMKFRQFSILCIFVIYQLINVTFVQCYDSDQNRNIVDEYVLRAKSECFGSKRIFSCLKYRAARYIWSLANGENQYFQKDTNSQMDTKHFFNIVQLSEPSTEMIFPEARQNSG